MSSGAVARSETSASLDRESQAQPSKITGIWKKIQSAPLAYKCAAGILILGTAAFLLSHFVADMDASITGGCAGAVAALALLILLGHHIHKRHREVLSFYQNQSYGHLLKPGEYYFYKGGHAHGYKRMIRYHSPESDIGLGSLFDFSIGSVERAGGKLVSLAELMERYRRANNLSHS